MDTAATVSNSYMQATFDAAISFGCPPEPLMEILDNGEAPFAVVTHRFPAAAYMRLLHEAEKLSGDTRIAIRAGMQYRPHPLLNAALMSAANIKDGFKLYSRYQPVTQEIGKTNLEIFDGEARIVWRPFSEDADWMRPATEMAYSAYATFGRWMTWLYNQKSPGLFFRHARPPHAEYTEEFLGGPITYNADTDYMMVPESLVDLPLPRANKPYHRALLQQLEKDLTVVAGGATMRASVEHCIRAIITDGAPSSGVIAGMLSLSERTLRRRLSEEGHSYREILETVRRDLCDTYLQDRSISFAKIAEDLGYSEQSAFSRAFKQWFGCSPSAYKRAQ